jgi:competence protein ComEA
MKRNSPLREYLHFSRKESIAVLLITICILAVFILPAVLPKNHAVAPVTDTAWIAALKKLDTASTGALSSANNLRDDNEEPVTFESTTRGTVPAPELFYFDPNTIDAAGWKKLGIRDKTIQTILNYRNKGGRFRKPADLQRIYGLFPDEYARIAPFIRIAGNSEAAAAATNSTSVAVTIPVAKPFPNKYSIIDINSADTASLVPLPGIGSKLAIRILNFRDKLGGFYSVSQVGETYGLPDSAFQKIKPYLKADANAVKKININTATLDDLKAHPYIRWAIANPLIAYRNEHGPFTSISELKKVMAVTDALYSKLEPYLSVQ